MTASSTKAPAPVETVDVQQVTDTARILTAAAIAVDGMTREQRETALRRAYAVITANAMTPADVAAILGRSRTGTPTYLVHAARIWADLTREQRDAATAQRVYAAARAPRATREKIGAAKAEERVRTIREAAKVAREKAAEARARHASRTAEKAETATPQGGAADAEMTPAAIAARAKTARATLALEAANLAAACVETRDVETLTAFADSLRETLAEVEARISGAFEALRDAA